MSFNNKNADSKKIYSILDRPPVLNCGGEKDKEGNDSYWGKSLTLQSDEQNANIHFILNKYEKTGALQAAIKQNPIYGDFSDMPSYQESLNLVIKANEQFSLLDATIRSRFANDPSKFLEFVNDSKNLDEMIKMGLATKKAEMPNSKGEQPAATPPAAASSGQQ